MPAGHIDPNKLANAVANLEGGNVADPEVLQDLLEDIADKVNSNYDEATVAANPNSVARRDNSGRLKSAAPSASDDVARKEEVDALEAKTLKNVVDLEIQNLGETETLISGSGTIDDQFVIIRIICPNANAPQTLGNSLEIPCITQHRSGQARYLLPIIDTIASGTINNVTSNSFEVTLPSHSSTYSYRVSRGASNGLLYIRSVSGTITGRTLVSIAVTGFPRG